MTATAADPKKARASWKTRVRRWLLAPLKRLFLGLLVVWTSLAVYYSNLPWAWLRLVLAVAVAAFSVWALWLSRRPRTRAAAHEPKPVGTSGNQAEIKPSSPTAAHGPGLAFAGLFGSVLVWYISIPPSHDRPWQPGVAVMPRATIDGDRVRITGFRNFDYRTRDDFTERWEDREVSLSHLTSVDFFLSCWGVGPVGHTFVSFNFDDAPPVCVSIEARTEVGERWAPVPALFKQFELIYVVGAERDVVGVRTNHRDEEVYLYRIRTAPENARRLFLVYLDRINELADRPEWYHLLSNNCTNNIVRHANAAGRVGRWDIRHLLNGWADRYLYDAGLVDTSLPFEELRRRSRINDAARAAGDGPDFSHRIRESLPGEH
ncbi:MAG: DUF4105 domain-containing protein [Zavarzinella sp.]|nr:DUF4105 domain-containing protein [Zavarzinella sp.]